MERSASENPEGLILEANVTASMMLRHRAALRQPAQPHFLPPRPPPAPGISMGGPGGPTLSPPRGFQPLSFLSGCFLENAVAWAVSVSKGMGDLCPFIQQTALYRMNATC